MNQEDKFKILRDILLTDEREYASSIHKKIQVLQDTINEQKNLSKKVDPIIDEKLDDFVEKIPQELGPVITQTLKSEIKNSQEEIVNALFPIIGKLIKKYVQHEMRLLSEKINKQINSKFSFSSLRRKFKAKRTGVNEGDLILQEQLKPSIEQLMVIEKDSGIIFSEFSKTQTIDQDTVSGMLTAIKHFVEDALNQEGQSLQYIEYNDYHIHIQNFSSYYIAVVISGTYNVIYRDKLEDTLLDFAKNHIHKEDLQDKSRFSKKLKVYFENENF